jgi:hypothetical protein
MAFKANEMVSDSNPYPVTTPPGTSLAVTDPAYDTDGTTLLAGGLPGGLKMVTYRTGGNVTSIRATNGTVTVSGDAPSIAGETVAFLQTILRYADGSVLSQGPWIKVV